MLQGCSRLRHRPVQAGAEPRSPRQAVAPKPSAHTLLWSPGTTAAAERRGVACGSCATKPANLPECEPFDSAAKYHCAEETSDETIEHLAELDQEDESLCAAACKEAPVRRSQPPTRPLRAMPDGRLGELQECNFYSYYKYACSLYKSCDESTHDFNIYPIGVFGGTLKVASCEAHRQAHACSIPSVSLRQLLHSPPLPLHR